MNKDRKDKNKKIENHDICCNSKYAGIMTEYADGELNGYKAWLFEHHMKHCAICANAVKTSRSAISMLSGARESYNNALSSVDVSETEEARRKLIVALRSDPSYGRGDTASRENPVRIVNVRKMIYSMSAAAAGIVLLTGVVLILSQGMDMLPAQNTYEGEGKHSFSSTVSEDSQNSDMNKEMTDDQADAGAPQDSSYDENRQEATTESDYMSIYDEEYRSAIGEALSYLEVNDADGPDFMVLTYKKDDMERYRDIFINIFDRSGTEVAIEIIGGDNPQKLVEYTGTQKAEEISAQAVAQGADILLISMGR